jgi:2,3-bisphosphoglycerate-dependent phosphoglycerate mutase
VGASAGAIRQLRFEAPPGSTRILLVRHGESVPAERDRLFDLIDGQGDPPLHSLGREQAERVADRLAGEPVRAIYVSTMRRTTETAAPLAARLGLKPVVDPDLREVHLGEWEGGVYRQRVLDGDPLLAQMITEERWDVVPGAEDTDAFSARVRRAIGRLAERHPDELVVVFTHGGVIGNVLSQATGSRRFAFLGADNGSISHIVVHGDRWVLRTYNDTAHLHPGFYATSEAPA